MHTASTCSRRSPPRLEHSQSFALTKLDEHLSCCLADAVREGGEEAGAKIAEATTAIARLLRT
jgi:hypothetical protein